MKLHLNNTQLKSNVDYSLFQTLLQNINLLDFTQCDTTTEESIWSCQKLHTSPSKFRMSPSYCVSFSVRLFLKSKVLWSLYRLVARFMALIVCSLIWGVSVSHSPEHWLMYDSFIPCHRCAPCSCVRPGTECGLSVRGTFRVSQNLLCPCHSLISHRLAWCCGWIWGLPQPCSVSYRNTLPSPALSFSSKRGAVLGFFILSV